MKKENLRIVFMGTPDFAVHSLRALVEGGYNIVGVVTMPDKAIGRHQTILQPSAVKSYAVSQGLPVLQPEKLKDEAFLTALHALNADLQIVVAFRMLPEVVWAMPHLGTFNLHAALLPQYRGAAPINWAIINGERKTGVTTFFLDKDIDTGRIIRRVEVSINETDNAEDVHDRLMVTGAKLVTDTVDLLLSGEIDTIDQAEEISDHAILHHAPKLFKENTRIDLSKGVERCYNFVRGLSPYPSAWTEMKYNGKRMSLKVFRTSKELCHPIEPLGTVITDGRKTLKIALEDGYLHLESLQPAGKKRMEVKDFLCGFHPEGTATVE